jgi:hypothetical protein
MPVAGSVANRVTPDLWPFPGAMPGAAPLGAALGAAAFPDAMGGGDLAERLALTLEQHQAFARSDAREVERLRRGCAGPHVAVPRLEGDVHDLSGLAALAAHL